MSATTTDQKKIINDLYEKINRLIAVGKIQTSLFAGKQESPISYAATALSISSLLSIVNTVMEAELESEFLKADMDALTEEQRKKLYESKEKALAILNNGKTHSIAYFDLFAEHASK